MFQTGADSTCRNVNDSCGLVLAFFFFFFTTGFRWIFEVLLKGCCMGYLLVSVLQTIAHGWQTRATVPPPPPLNGSIIVESYKYIYCCENRGRRETYFSHLKGVHRNQYSNNISISVCYISNSN